MHHKTAAAPQTAGRVLRGARWYDLFGRVISLGRDKAIREKLIELAAPAPGENVLDVGCGTGTLAIALKPKVGTGEVRGIDASPEMIEVARKKAAKAGYDIDFEIALIEAIPFPDGSFDLVTSSLMLHHLPDDLKRAGLAEIRRVLKPGGRVLTMDFSVHSHSPLCHHLPLIFGHARGENTVDKLAPMLKDAGLSDIEVVPTRHKNFAFIRAMLGENPIGRPHQPQKQCAKEETPVADLPPCRGSHGDAGNRAGVRPDRGSTTGTPHWVKVFGIIALVGVLLFVILHLTGNNPFGGPGSHTPPPNATERGVQ